jgi:hypothetical protein
MDAMIQSMLPLARWAASAAALVSAITSNDVPTARVSGSPEQEHERGDDDKTAAHPEEAGQHARCQTNWRDAGERGLPAARRRLRPAPQHRDRSDEQKHCEGEQDRPAADDPVQRRAGDRAGGAGRAEGQPRSWLHAADPRVIGRADERCRANDQQRLHRRVLDRLSEQVDEHGHGQNRAAAADETEQEPDREPEWEGEERLAQAVASRP